MLGKIEGKRRGRQRIRWLESITVMDMSLSKLWERLKDTEAGCKACRICDFLGGTVDKNLLANARDIGLIPGLGRFHMSRGI